MDEESIRAVWEVPGVPRRSSLPDRIQGIYCPEHRDKLCTYHIRVTVQPDLLLGLEEGVRGGDLQILELL